MFLTSEVIGLNNKLCTSSFLFYVLGNPHVIFRVHINISWKMNKKPSRVLSQSPNENTILARSTWKVIPTGNKVDTQQKWQRELGLVRYSHITTWRTLTALCMCICTCAPHFIHNFSFSSLSQLMVFLLGLV